MQLIELPASWPTSCTFGSTDLSTLYVTSARFTMTNDHLDMHPLEGGLFAVEGVGRGVEEPKSGRRRQVPFCFGDSVMSDFNGKSIVVTGGSLGMGLACAHRFAAGGGKVTIVANDKASVDEAVASIGDNAAGFVGDVRSKGDMEAAVQAAMSRHGGVDILACCAGIQRYGTVVDTPDEVWDDVLDINLKGIFLASKFAIPEMRKRGGGAIVAISSVQAYASQTGVAAYTASKGAINALVRAMALDHARDNITVNAVCPASIDTPMLRWAADLWKGEGTAEATLEAWGKGHPLGRVGKSSEVANLSPSLPATRPASSRAPTSRSTAAFFPSSASSFQIDRKARHETASRFPLERLPDRAYARDHGFLPSDLPQRGRRRLLQRIPRRRFHHRPEDPASRLHHALIFN